MTEERILLAHGDGGALTHRLVKEIFLRYLRHPALRELTDAALLHLPEGRLAMTTDTFVVKPIFFPGGDIGKLAVAGTVNDLAVTGARPRYLTAGFILEEGFPLADLERVVASLARTAQEAGVAIVAGDTKVVERGCGDGIYINTAGVGVVADGCDLGYHRIMPGDVVLINGTIGDHGLSILSKRAGIEFETPVESDCAPLNGVTEMLLDRFPDSIRFMRDPTRGGVATTLNEVSQSTGCDIILDESALPIREEVQGAAELLGLDPLYLANEGKVLIVAASDAAEAILSALREHPLGSDAAAIGRVEAGRGGAFSPGAGQASELTAEPGPVSAQGKGRVFLRTPLGGHRILDMLAGDPLPRIC
ncbi:hydrogenase expression/formation protein HypE [Heliobacterium gestii]|uniref:Hydrogenase expression/formation protein HypE n=1 Tax=Heliomicrobium gestii TaxID=2699 RepID=A0A845LBD6_HELGE|nr:hydrogenase expression/formation protein HypE [Heliomicrobium gestii]MBM7865732.1 hydrogenase expression/formation protein HypE [Heliomicrobium gestii]MZP41979.1 hydrogenase expression/formation protein HypE [Heliomicrobium gestii]